MCVCACLCVFVHVCVCAFMCVCVCVCVFLPGRLIEPGASPQAVPHLQGDAVGAHAGQQPGPHPTAERDPRRQDGHHHRGRQRHHVTHHPREGTSVCPSVHQCVRPPACLCGVCVCVLGGVSQHTRAATDTRMYFLFSLWAWHHELMRDDLPRASRTGSEAPCRNDALQKMIQESAKVGKQITQLIRLTGGEPPPRARTSCCLVG